ncbi:MAG: hypothetical protein AAFN93_27530 [Bacteroidota bacterium]
MQDSHKEGKLVYDNDMMNKGIKSIIDHIRNNRPIQVGVNYRSYDKQAADHKINNHDLSTDHFVVLTNMKYDESNKQYYFEFFEPGTATSNKNTKGINSKENRIYLIKNGSSYKLKSLVGPPGDRKAKKSKNSKYEVTQIRPNGDFPDSKGTIHHANDKKSNCQGKRVCY